MLFRTSLDIVSSDVVKSTFSQSENYALEAELHVVGLHYYNTALLTYIFRLIFQIASLCDLSFITFL